MTVLQARLFYLNLKKEAIPKCYGFRGMATLKDISTRLKSVKNIQKITQSMKMVSAAKFSRAERELKAAKPLGEGMVQFYEKSEVGKPDEQEMKIESADKTPRGILYVAVTSDRGLCGAVHSSVSRKIRSALQEFGDRLKVVCIGDKSRVIIQRTNARNILLVCNEIGRLPATFLDASKIANEIIRTECAYESAKIVYNKFRSVVSYVTSEMPFFQYETVASSKKVQNYEEAEDEETLLSFVEFTMAGLIFYALKEAACSEQSARMTAMDNASKNAGEMIGQLTLTFNRTRQAVITRELIEIISGASAL